MRQCQLRRQTTSVGICCQQGREEDGEDMDWVWLCDGCVMDVLPRPYRKWG